MQNSLTRVILALSATVSVVFFGALWRTSLSQKYLSRLAAAEDNCVNLTESRCGNVSLCTWHVGICTNMESKRENHSPISTVKSTHLSSTSRPLSKSGDMTAAAINVNQHCQSLTERQCSDQSFCRWHLGTCKNVEPKQKPSGASFSPALTPLKSGSSSYSEILLAPIAKRDCESLLEIQCYNLSLLCKWNGGICQSVSPNHTLTPVRRSSASSVAKSSHVSATRSIALKSDVQSTPKGQHCEHHTQVQCGSQAICRWDAGICKNKEIKQKSPSVKVLSASPSHLARGNKPTPIKTVKA